jgi:hypothetical protein
MRHVNMLNHYTKYEERYYNKNPDVLEHDQTRISAAAQETHAQEIP